MRPQGRPNDGILRLLLQHNGVRTIIRECYYRVPLQILRPLYLDDTGTAYVYLLNPCGGVLGGDLYSITLTLEDNAHAYLTTPSATKLYAAPQQAAQQHIHIRLDAGAVLTYMPDQVIPYANAAFRQHMTVRLGPGACFFMGEILAPGRLARGERFAYRDYDASISIKDARDTMLLHERTRLQPSQRHPGGIGLLEDYAYLGTFYALCDGHNLPPALSDDLHVLLSDRPELIGSATTLEHGGLAVRLLGQDHGGVNQALCDIWDRLSQLILGYPAAPYRK